jgi:short subunit dehydrogenase-like uncharacterized protein
MQNRGLLIYGSYGYSGDLITRRAIERGLSPILAGRDVNALRRQAEVLALEYRVAPLNDPAALHTALHGVGAVLHCAGPFIHTSRPMVDACVQAGAHYIDITGEIPVFERLAARDGEARARGVMLLPGAGFDVVPTDCLAVHLGERLPGSTELVLAFESAGGISRGTAGTVVEHIGAGSVVRREGELRRVPLGHSTRMVDFGSGERLTVAHPWGDLSTAWRSTGIPNITVYRATTWAELRLMPVLRAGLPLLATRPAQRLLRTWVRRRVRGPDADARRAGFSRFYGEVRRSDGAIAAARLRAPEAYTLTAHTAVACAERTLAGDVRPGYATPGMAYGADFILSIADVRREDLQPLTVDR